VAVKLEKEMGLFDKVPGRPSKKENEIAEKVAREVRYAIRSQGLAGAAVDALIGEYIAKYASDSSRTIFRNVKSLI
jgi:hypothetical protein